MIFILAHHKLYISYNSTNLYRVIAMPRKKENRETMLCQIAQGNKTKFQEIAKILGYQYAGNGSQGKLVDAICAGEIILIKSSDKT